MGDLRDKLAEDMACSVIKILNHPGKEDLRTALVLALRGHLNPRNVNSPDDYLDKYPKIRERVDAARPKLRELFPDRRLELELSHWQEQCHTCSEGQFLNLHVMCISEDEVDEAMGRMGLFEEWFHDQFPDWCHEGGLLIDLAWEAE